MTRMDSSASEQAGVSEIGRRLSDLESRLESDVERLLRSLSSARESTLSGRWSSTITLAAVQAVLMLLYIVYKVRTPAFQTRLTFQRRVKSRSRKLL